MRSIRFTRHNSRTRANPSSTIQDEIVYWTQSKSMAPFRLARSPDHSESNQDFVTQTRAPVSRHTCTESHRAPIRIILPDHNHQQRVQEALTSFSRTDRARLRYHARCLLEEQAARPIGPFKMWTSNSGSSSGGPLGHDRPNPKRPALEPCE